MPPTVIIGEVSAYEQADNNTESQKGQLLIYVAKYLLVQNGLDYAWKQPKKGRK